MTMDVGILLLRLLFGLPMAAHGAQKLFGWFGGYGIKGTGGFFEGIGFRPGVVFATAAGLGEFLGGLLLALGLFTPAGGALMISVMLVAMVSVHLKNGFFSTSNGIEVPYLYAVTAVGLAFTGGGAFSMDAMLGLSFVRHASVIGALLLLSVIGSAAILTVGRHHQAQPAAQQ